MKEVSEYIVLGTVHKNTLCMTPKNILVVARNVGYKVDRERNPQKWAEQYIEGASFMNVLPGVYESKKLCIQWQHQIPYSIAEQCDIIVVNHDGEQDFPVNKIKVLEELVSCGLIYEREDN